MYTADQLAEEKAPFRQGEAVRFITAPTVKNAGEWIVEAIGLQSGALHLKSLDDIREGLRKVRTIKATTEEVYLTH